MIRVFLLDDHELVRRGLTDLLSTEPDIEVAGEAGTARQAMDRIPAVRPDVAILDVRLPDGDGVTVCRNLRSRLPELRCLILTSYNDDDALVRAVLAGAAGYVLKDILGNDLIDAVRTVAGGGSLLEPTAAGALMDAMRRGADSDDQLAGLTDQERNILRLIGQGMTNRQIGEELYLAEKTVKNYVSNLFAKLGLHRRTQAAVLASQIWPRRGEA